MALYIPEGKEISQIINRLDFLFVPRSLKQDKRTSEEKNNRQITD